MGSACGTLSAIGRYGEGGNLLGPFLDRNMTDFIKFEWDKTQAEAYFAQLLTRGSDLQPLMADIGETLVESTQARFGASTAPDGSKWEEVKRGGLPLVLTGTLRDEINHIVGSDFVEVFSARPYGLFHQEGTKDENGVQLIVPRVFLGISDQDRSAIEGLALGYLDL